MQKGDIRMSRTKGALGKKTLEKLKQVYNNIEPKEEPKKRHRRTKEELIKAGYYQQKEEPKQLPKPKKEHTHVQLVKSYTRDEVSELMMQRAKERGLEDWDYDFRTEYAKGQTIWYVEVSYKCQSKEILELHVGTVYSRFIIGYVERGEAHHIGVEDADKIFLNENKKLLPFNKTGDTTQLVFQLDENLKTQIETYSFNNNNNHKTN